MEKDLLENEIREAEYRLSNYHAWRRYAQELEDAIESTVAFSDLYQEKVIGGPMPVHPQERIVEAKERNRELQRVLRNVAIVEEALGLLTEEQRGFADLYWLSPFVKTRAGDHAENVAEELEVSRATVFRWRDACLLRMMIVLLRADSIILKA